MSTESDSMTRPQHVISDDAKMAASVIADAGRPLTPGEIVHRMHARGVPQTERIVGTTLERARQLGLIAKTPDGGWIYVELAHRRATLVIHFLHLAENLKRETPSPSELALLIAIHRMVGERLGVLSGVDASKESTHASAALEV